MPCHDRSPPNWTARGAEIAKSKSAMSPRLGMVLFVQLPLRFSAVVLLAFWSSAPQTGRMAAIEPSKGATVPRRRIREMFMGRVRGLARRLKKQAGAEHRNLFFPG